jgi:hypothetical protein
LYIEAYFAARETATKATSTAEVAEVLVDAVQSPQQPVAQPSPATSSAASSSPEPVASTGDRECPLCLAELPEPCFPALATCDHRSCYDCLQTYLRVEISESRTAIACPQCSERLHPNGECCIAIMLKVAKIFHFFPPF